MYQLAAIPLISALIGYITNVVAIKLLFWPQRPVNFVFFEIYGLLPKRKAEIAANVGKLVEEQLLSFDELFDKIDNPQLRESIIKNMVQAMKERLYGAVARFVPDKILRLLEDAIEKVFRQEADKLIKLAIKSGREYVAGEIRLSAMVEDKINNYNLNELETMVRSVSSKELRFIEILGGILGFIIGLAQVAILMIFPF